MIRILKRVYSVCMTIWCFFYGIIAYAFSGRTPERGYQALIGLFCLTRGYSSDLFVFLINLFKSKVQFAQTSGILGDMSGDNLKKTLGQLNQNGYVVFESALPEKLLNSLIKFTEDTDALTRLMDAQVGSGQQVQRTRFDANNLTCVRYEYKDDDLLENEAVQQFISDPSILSLAQAYLGSLPILDIVTMWWHCNFSDQPDKNAAQYFHFDMDRVKWLKFFVYLTDVGPDNGPHTFIETSHRSGKIPYALLKKGYTRLTDEEVSAQYSKDKWIEFCGPKGTIIAEDTRGLHKGKHVSGSPRLLFQIEYAVNLFGTALPTGRIKRVTDPQLEMLLKENPGIFKAYFR